MTGAATIHSALDDFLVWTRLTNDGPAFTAACEVVDHLRACCNAYGPDALPEAERVAFNASSGGADFCAHLGPERIIANLQFFLDFYMVRNVVTSTDVLAATGTVIALLASWLEDNRYAEPELARLVRRQGTFSASALPRAERMATLLTDLASAATRDPAVETTEGFLPITDVGDDALWLDDVGPVAVGAQIAALARPGWIVSIVLACVDGTWTVYDVGNVYPRMDSG